MRGVAELDVGGGGSGFNQHRRHGMAPNADERDDEKQRAAEETAANTILIPVPVPVTVPVTV